MSGDPQDELGSEIRQFKASFVVVALPGVFSNILVLCGLIYIILVYDLVLPRGSGSTLLGLLAIVVMVHVSSG